jgi:hypothetical protein
LKIQCVVPGSEFGGVVEYAPNRPLCREVLFHLSAEFTQASEIVLRVIHPGRPVKPEVDEVPIPSRFFSGDGG